MDHNQIAVLQDDQPVLLADAHDRWTVEAMTERAKVQIAEDVRSGLVPPTVRSFAELHDHRDANGYADLFDDDAPLASYETFWPEDVTTAVSAHLDRVNAMQDEVDAWLRHGDLLDAVGAVTVYLKVTTVPTDAIPDINREDVEDALYARLDEFYPQGTYPVVPTVEVIDGPEA